MIRKKTEFEKFMELKDYQEPKKKKKREMGDWGFIIMMGASILIVLSVLIHFSGILEQERVETPCLIGSSQTLEIDYDTNTCYKYVVKEDWYIYLVLLAATGYPLGMVLIVLEFIKKHS